MKILDTQLKECGTTLKLVLFLDQWPAVKRKIDLCSWMCEAFCIWKYPLEVHFNVYGKPAMTVQLFHVHLSYHAGVDSGIYSYALGLFNVSWITDQPQQFQKWLSMAVFPYTFLLGGCSVFEIIISPVFIQCVMNKWPTCHPALTEW